MEEQKTQEVLVEGTENIEKAVSSFIPKVFLENEWMVRLITAIVILLVGLILYKIIVNLVQKTLKRSKMDEVVHTFILNCLKVILWIALLLTFFSYLGVPISTFIAILGTCGVAVALALKDSLANFAGGILIIMTKPFSKGDYIEDLTIGGIVEKIDLLYSTLTSSDNKVIMIPNGKLANATIVNYSRSNFRRVDCSFRIARVDQIEKAKQILKDVAEGCSTVLQQPPMVIGVANQSEGTIELDLKAWCKTPNYYDTKYYLEENVRLALDKAEIETLAQIIRIRLDKTEL